MRTIRVSGGFNDYAIGTLTEMGQRPLVLTEKKLALVPQNDPAPDVGDAAWRDPDLVETVETWKIRLGLLVDDEWALGAYYLWALPTDNPTVTPVRASNHLIVLV